MIGIKEDHSKFPSSAAFRSASRIRLPSSMIIGIVSLSSNMPTTLRQSLRGRSFSWTASRDSNSATRRARDSTVGSFVLVLHNFILPRRKHPINSFLAACRRRLKPSDGRTRVCRDSLLGFGLLDAFKNK